MLPSTVKPTLFHLVSPLVPPTVRDTHVTVSTTAVGRDEMQGWKHGQPPVFSGASFSLEGVFLFRTWNGYSKSYFFHVVSSRQDWKGGGEQGRAGVQAQAQGDYAVLRQLPLAGAVCVCVFCLNDF